MKKYRCPISNRIILGTLLTIVLILLAFLLIYGIVMLALHKYNSVFDIIPIVLVCFMLPLLGLIFFRKTLPEIAGKLIVSNSRIVWKCFLYKTVALNIDECSCVGVKIFATSYKGYIKNIQNEYGRGDEFAYIYISKFAISDNCFSTIGSTPCKNGFIKFLYSDSLCKELMNILPKSKVTYLASFYNQMQIADRTNKLKRQNKKKRKSKKK